MSTVTVAFFSATDINGTFNPTSSVTEPEMLWVMSRVYVIIANVFLSVNLFGSLSVNTLLILVIYFSPNLRTAPNIHLVNICVNNLLLCLAMVASLVSLNMNASRTDRCYFVFSGVQLVLVMNAMLQYVNAFAAIGYYRYRTISKPATSLKFRKRLIQRCITSSWLSSVVLSIIFTLSFVDNSDDIRGTVNPFRKVFNGPMEPSKQDYDIGVNVEQLAIMYIVVLAFAISFVIIIRSYYKICRALNVGTNLGKNRVTPFSRAPSITSDSTDLIIPSRRSYLPVDSNWTRPFTISENFIVHYQKRDQSLFFEDILALENPILAASRTQSNKRSLKVTLSTDSGTSLRSQPPDFTDISPGGELQRFQNLKNSSALRNQSLKRDRVSLSSATKNSLIMMVAFLMCSLPLFICFIPGVLHGSTTHTRISSLFFTRILFYLNSPIYPVWFLVFSKRVRKCLGKIVDVILLKLAVRS